MATIRELQASFVARASGMKSTIQSVKKDIQGLATDTKKVTKGMSSDFKNGTTGISKSVGGLSKSFRNMSTSASKSFESIGKSMQNTGKSLENWGSDIKDVGKKATVALSPLTAFYGAAALTGGSRLMANEQLDILMKNTFRTTEAYEDAWDAVNGLTKGTAFMNSDVGGWLSQLVQSNVELGKSEDIMKSVLDFSVGSGQLGVEGEIQGIIMKAVRADGWDETTLTMLADRGLNLAGHIANVLGIETSAAQDMLKDGTISMEDSLDYFVDAVQVGSEGAGGYFAKMEGSAQKGGETMLGAWINTKAAIAKLGEDMWKGGAWDQLKEGLNSFYEFIYELAPALEPMAGIIASVLATAVDWIQKVMTAFINLRPKTQALIAGLSVVGAVIGPVIFFFGKFVGIVGKALKPLGGLFRWFGKIFKVIGAKGLGGALKTLASRFSFLLGPVGIAVGVITLLVSTFTLAYKKSETFRNIVHKLRDAFVSAYEKIKEFLTTNETLLKFIDNIKKGFETLKGHVTDAIGAIVSFFKDKIGEMTKFWKSDGDGLLKAVSNIFKGIWLVIEPIIKAILAIVKVSLPIIQKILSVTFKVILAVIKSVWGNIKGVIDGGLKIIMGLIQVFSGIFTGDFSKMWEGIKNLFTGAIQFIWNFVQLMFWGKLLKGVVGFIKGFSGPIGAMWTGIKNVFSTVIKWIVDFVKNRFTSMSNTISTISSTIQNFISIIWNGILAFFRFVIKAIVDFVKTRFTNLKNNVTTIFNAVKNFITTVWNGILAFFKFVIKGIVDFVKTSFTNLKNNVTTIFNAVKNFISTVWNGILAFFKFVIKAIVDFVKSRFENLKNNITTIFNAIRDIAKKVWNKIKDNIVNPITNAVKTAIDKFVSFKKSVTDTFKNIKDSVFGYVSDMVQKVKDMPGEMKKGIVSMAHKVFEGMKSIANKMQDGLKAGVNGVVTGVNWVMGKLNVPKDKHLGKWSPKKLAHGTNSHEGGDAILGDGRGSNSGSELVRLPSGQEFMSADKDTLYRDLPKGTQVLSATNTRKYLESIPAYAKGVGKAKNFIDKAKAVGKVGGNAARKQVGRSAAKVTKKAFDVWDYVKDPEGLLGVALKTLGISSPKSGSTFGDIARGGFNKVRTSAVDYVKGKLDAFSDAEDGGGGGGGPVSFGSLRKTSNFGMRFHPIFKQWRLHGGDDYGGKVGTAIKATTGGRVTSSGPSGTGFGTMVKVKNGMYDYIYAHLSRAIAKIGSSVSKGDVIGALGNTGNSTGPHLHYEVRKGGRAVKPGAYADGGIVNQKQLAWIAEGGWAESIISHDPAKKVRQQKIWQQTGDSLGFTSGTQDKEMLSTLMRIAKAVERDFSINMDSQKVGELTEPHVTNKQQRSQNRRRRHPK